LKFNKYHIINIIFRPGIIVSISISAISESFLNKNNNNHNNNTADSVPRPVKRDPAAADVVWRESAFVLSIRAVDSKTQSKLIINVYNI